MTTSEAIAAKTEKIKMQRDAYRELLKMRDYFHLRYGKTRQEELDKSLLKFAKTGGFINQLDVNRVEIENRIVRLMIAAGANPDSNLFWQFMYLDNLKPHCALEIAKADGFKQPRDLDIIFKIIAEDALKQQIQHGKIFQYAYHETEKEFENRKKISAYTQELVYTLFEKGMKPKNPQILKDLQPIYEAEKKRLAQASRPTSNTPTGGRSGVSR